MPITKKEKAEKILSFAQRHMSERGTLRRLNRFTYFYSPLGSRYGYFIVSYQGSLERFLLSKILVLNNPEVIADSWIEENKGKFQENEDSFHISKEFKNFPFFGVTPYRIFRRLGTEVSVQEADGLCYLYFRAQNDVDAYLKGTCTPARGLKALLAA